MKIVIHAMRLFGQPFGRLLIVPRRTRVASKVSTSKNSGRGKKVEAALWRLIGCWFPSHWYMRDWLHIFHDRMLRPSRMLHCWILLCAFIGKDAIYMARASRSLSEKTIGASLSSPGWNFTCGKVSTDHLYHFFILANQEQSDTASGRPFGSGTNCLDCRGSLVPWGMKAWTILTCSPRLQSLFSFPLLSSNTTCNWIAATH
jgi:hypothetical protein